MLRARFGDKVQMPVITQPAGMLAGLMGRKPGAGAQMSVEGLSGLPEQVISALETRAIWARFGF